MQSTDYQCVMFATYRPAWHAIHGKSALFSVKRANYCHICGPFYMGFPKTLILNMLRVIQNLYISN